MQFKLEKCQEYLNDLDKAYKESTLPDKVDRSFWLKLLLKIRNEYERTMEKI